MARSATVVGSGPNGLAAAVSLARAGYQVRVLEAQQTAGGGVLTKGLTLPGFRHDVCSAVHPAAHSSPFFRAFGLDRIEWIRPEISFAHPLDDGRAAIAWRDLDRTTDGLGADGKAWRSVMRPLNRNLERVVDFTGNQLLRLPRHPLTAARFGMRALEVGTPAIRGRFRTEEGAALYAGVAAHANTRLISLAASGAALLLLAHAHSTGWPYPRGGAQAIADALIADLRAHGGDVETGRDVRSLAEVRDDIVLLDTSPRLLLTDPDLPSDYARALSRYRYGPAVAKVDFALDGPVPWSNPEVAASPTVHVGGTLDEIEASETAVARGRVSAQPYVLVVQPSVLDPTRAPEGSGTLWAYIHVPLNSRLDPTELVLTQLERFAPGIRDRVIAVHATSAADRAQRNPADIGGDILGGSFTLGQALRRPVLSRTPWRTPLPGVYLASASTPPGPGVNGLPGWYAARQALHDAGVRVELEDLFR
jgi:phytoene dehydrogenase-like protein